MKHLALFFNGDAGDRPGATWLLVGGGKVATRRARSLTHAGASFDLVCIEPSAEIERLCSGQGGRLERRAWIPEDLDFGYRFAVAATDDANLNAQIAAACRERNIAVNVATDGSLSDFVFAQTIDREPLTIAVCSGSASPILARLLAERIDSLIPAGYGKLAELVRKYRQRVRQTFATAESRKQFWEKVLLGSVAETVFSGNAHRAEHMLEHALEKPMEQQRHGEVYLIGAGPGDPDLLTFRAYRLLQQSDVVLYDRLVSDEILQQVNPDAEMVYVGKQRSHHSVPQPAINQQLLDLAQEGKRVARLKGGDPFIFGRGGEEIEQLAEHKIPFQVVPGITAASGCASYSGIPLTHRDHAQSVRFVTGQLQDGTVNLPWLDLVADNQTLVFYMGLNGLPIISRQLIAHGLDPDTPAAMIEKGTTLSQIVHCSSLEKLPELMRTKQVSPPTLMIIGSVVTLHDKLNWFTPEQWRDPESTEKTSRFRE